VTRREQPPSRHPIGHRRRETLALARRCHYDRGVPLDAAAAARLYRTYGPAVYRRCLRLLRDRELARDATQDVFVQLLRQWTASTEPEVVLHWIYRVATNHCLNLLRNVRRHGEQPLELCPVHDVPGSPSEPQRLVAQQVLSRFDAVTQAVAVGVFVDGMEHEELARALGISRRTVSRRLDRFVESAREYLARGEG
jgi:RNA polymerase sigma-70 factor (ECF subfamily)